MNRTTLSLELRAKARKIRVHDPFAEFLESEPSIHSFELSLLDCYRFAGHACHAVTGSFLLTEMMVNKMFPETLICERGDVAVDFGSLVGENATGPRSNVISFITGAWGESGFGGLKGDFIRRNLVSYGVPGIPPKAIRFRRLSTGRSITAEYNASAVTSDLKGRLEFPQSWRMELCLVLDQTDRAIHILNQSPP